MNELIGFFSWLNDDESRYQSVSGAFIFGFAALVVAAAFSPKLDAFLARRRGLVAFFGLMLLVVLAARWPTFFVRHRLNPDEAQMAAQAITAFHDPIPWLGFDGGTSGPLNTYVLMLPALVGAHVSFMTTRIIAVLLEIGAIAALYAVANLLFDSVIARLAVVPPVVFWSVSTQDDFVHYSSEHLSIFLGSLLLALLAFARRRCYPPGLVYAAGLVGGMMPFAKLQSVPLAEALCGLAVVMLAVDDSRAWRGRARRLALFGIGLVTCCALVLGVVAASGSLIDFWNAYILTPLAYSRGSNLPVSFLTETVEFGPFFDLSCVTAIVGLAILAGRFTAVPLSTRLGFFALLAVFAGAVDAIFSPHHGSFHYLLFGVIPTAGLAAAGLATIAWFFDERRTAGVKRGALAAVFVATCLVAQNAVVRPHYNWIGYDFYDYQRGGPEDPLSAQIRTDLKPGERLAIWGWYPEYWVFSGTLLGTRDSVSIFQISPHMNPCRDYFRKRYIADFERTKPAGFLDAGAESFDYGGGLRHGYEEFSELAAIVNADYVLAGRWKRFRFFVRRDLAARSRSGAIAFRKRYTGEGR